MWQAVQLFCDGGIGTGVKIIDPAAGKGSILDVVLSQGEVPTRSVYGIEIDPGLEKQRVGKTCRARFFTGDGLLDEFPGVDPGSFDLVIGNPPFGLFGAQPGLPHRYSIVSEGVERELGSKETGVLVKPGARIICLSSGGGGYGDPGDRPQAQREWDLKNGYCT